ncbi:MAG: hypothetical protein JXM79_17060 [Sedimentisphaerales bacterium]|nr:hypothetical protein [Sedimentisphaerales bacterium]
MAKAVRFDYSMFENVVDFYIYQLNRHFAGTCRRPEDYRPGKKICLQWRPPLEAAKELVEALSARPALLEQVKLS